MPKYAAAGLSAPPTGYILAWILAFVINQRSFGWTLLMHVAPAPYAEAFVLAVSAALLAAALYPAWRLGRMQAADALRGAWDDCVVGAARAVCM